MKRTNNPKIFRRLVNIIFRQNYGLEPTDFELTDDQISDNIKNKIRPEVLVRDYAEKYDLVPIRVKRGFY